MPDVRKGLHLLHREWEHCRDCDLGEGRDSRQEKYVAGEGQRRGVMFIGEGPGVHEGQQGRPFLSKAGALVRYAVEKRGLAPYAYFTYSVACRSCELDTYADGTPRTRGGELAWLDRVPSRAQQTACWGRLHEEIYLVDPVLIVCLGRDAAQALTGGKVNIREASGSPVTIAIQGAGLVPNITAKKGEWLRKSKGKFHLPVDPFEVRYTMIPLLSPGYVLLNHADRRHDGPVDKFTKGFNRITDIYNRIMLETYGDFTVESSGDLSADDIDRIAQ